MTCAPAAHGRLKAGPWLDALRAEHAKRQSDAAIADALEERFFPQPFTRRTVRYWRAVVLGLPAWPRPRPRECGRNHQLEDRVCDLSRRLYQHYSGWGHLLSGYRRPVPCATVRRWAEGLDLTPRECDLLSCLRDCGELTGPELALRLGLSCPGHRGPRRRGRSVLARLSGLGLVVWRPAGRRRAYSLDPDLPRREPRPPADLEKLHAALLDAALDATDEAG